MVRSTRKRPEVREASLPPLPLTVTHWQAVVDALQLSMQEARVVELILRGACEKQIAAMMGIAHATVRTYVTRISAKTATHGRMELALHVLGVSHQVVSDGRCQPN